MGTPLSMRAPVAQPGASAAPPMPPNAAGVAPGADEEGAEGAADDEAGSSEPFKRPDLSKFIPPDQKDVVDRVVAAGMKIMFSPATRDDLQAAVASQEPCPKVIAENVSGLMLTLDQKSKGGIPQAAIFPAAAELAGEAAELLVQAGKPVTMGEYHDALLAMYGILGRKLGGKPEELMGAAQQSLAGGNPTPPPEGQAAPAAGIAPPQGAPMPEGAPA